MSRVHDGSGIPTARGSALADGLRLRAIKRLRRVLRVQAEGLPELRFGIDTTHEYNRATHAFAAEPGTVAWIRETVRPGDVFLDVGANIGIFTLLAAKLVGPEGRVCAFEPHAATLPRLLANVVANDVQDRVTVMSVPLHDRADVLPFHYRSLEAASGLSQLDRALDPFGEAVVPEVSELKLTTTVDDLVARGAIPPPTVVKLDVDGNEPGVLRGMREVLTGDAPPRAVQVEVNPAEGDAVLGLLDDAGFELVHRHLTAGGARLVRDGADEATMHFNGVFAPRSAG